MPIPRQKDIEVPLLEEIAKAGGSTRPGDLYPRLAQRFSLTQAERAERTVSGYNRFQARVGWTRNLLVNQGEIARLPRGIWTITDKGRQRIGDSNGPSPHNELIQMMADIGTKIGRDVRREYKPNVNAPFTFDVALAATPYVSPDLLVQICAKGDVERDNSSFHWAKHYMKAKCLWILVDEGDFARAQKLRGEEPEVFIMKAQALTQLHALLSAGYAPALKALFQ